MASSEFEKGLRKELYVTSPFSVELQVVRASYRAGYLAALSDVRKNMPRADTKRSTAGWNRYLSVMDECISELESGAGKGKADA